MSLKSAWPWATRFVLVRYVKMGGKTGFMTYHLEIPASIASSLKLPPSEIQPRLRIELAIALYGQGILSFGKASELAELSRFAFADFIAQRNIPRHYTEDELLQDISYGRGQ